MKIQLASDLHLEFIARHFPGERLVTPADADLLVLAGDIANGLKAVEAFARWEVPVLYVLGNHEAYGWDLHLLRRQLLAASQGTSVVVLDNTRADFSRFTWWEEKHRAALKRVRFLGGTLWTDYRLRTNRTQRQLMENAALRIADHQRIAVGDRWFQPKDALAEHEITRAWLAEELAKPFDGTTVVVTHHGPHPLSVHPRWAGDALNAAFVSHLDDLLFKADLWLHGHVHDSFDYRVGRCRVVANPRGYPGNLSSAPNVNSLQFENVAYQAHLVIEV